MARTVTEQGYVKIGGNFEHKLVWERKYGMVPEGMIIHHIDENKKNNSIDNLTLATRKEHFLLHSDDYAEYVGEWYRLFDSGIMIEADYWLSIANKVRCNEYLDKTRERNRINCRKWYWNHKDVQLQKNKEWRETNKDRVKRYNQSYYEENKDHLKKQMKEYRATHMDEKRYYNEKYLDRHREENKERCREYLEAHREENRIRCRERYYRLKKQKSEQ